MSVYSLIMIKQGTVHSCSLQDPRKEHSRMQAYSSPCPPHQWKIEFLSSVTQIPEHLDPASEHVVYWKNVKPSLQKKRMIADKVLAQQKHFQETVNKEEAPRNQLSFFLQSGTQLQDCFVRRTF